jgi:hypothetical protein
MCSNSHVLCRESSCACAAITALALRQILHFIDLKIAQAKDHENAMKLAKGQGLCICHVCVFARTFVFARAFACAPDCFYARDEAGM